ncbi:unnamed protein product [Rotaria sp. Silwood2]|nr:unnamed protein product [Rotaria sp. Silwood2]
MADIERGTNENRDPIESIPKPILAILGSIHCLVILCVTLIIPILEVAIGASYRDQCPINSNIPVYLIVTGACGMATIVLAVVIVAAFICCIKRNSIAVTFAMSCLVILIMLFIGLMSVFLFAWFIVLDTIEQFVSAVETALKSCSDQLNPSQPSTIDNTSVTSINKSPLLGVSRIGALVKNLLIKSDRLFQIVVICTEWPTMNLFEKLFSVLHSNFHETWKSQINIQCQKDDETIQVHTNTVEGQMSVSISFTSSSIPQEDSQTSEQLLTKTNCLNALYAMHSVRWFQSHISTRQHASALIRCLRYKTKISSNWQSLSSEIIEILIEHTLSKSVSAVCAFRRVLEYLSGGLILSNGPGLRIPWETDSINNIYDKLSDQERNDITHEAQIGLRFMAFEQLNKWLEQYDIPKVMKSFQKRSYPDDQNQVAAKRQCLESDNIEEQ